MAHLGKSLKAEAGALSSPVGIHTLSPGMVLTDLLLDGATYANKQIFNILCEQVGHCCAVALAPPLQWSMCHSPQVMRLPAADLPRHASKLAFPGGFMQRAPLHTARC